MMSDLNSEGIFQSGRRDEDMLLDQTKTKWNK